MPKVVIITGGFYTETRTTLYNSEGFLEDWPSLNRGRFYHACGHFVNSDNRVVVV